MSPPGWFLSLWISLGTSSAIRVELFHSTSFRVVETTYFGKAFIRSAIGSVAEGQYSTNPSYVTRPISTASAATSSSRLWRSESSSKN